MPYRITTEHERRAQFLALEQQSSLTAWRRVYELHQTFVDVVEVAYQDGRRNPSANPNYGCYVNALDMDFVHQSHAALRHAIDRLSKGDHSPFKFLRAPGHIYLGMLAIKCWEDDLGRYLHMGGSYFPPYHSPHWPQIDLVMQACLQAYAELKPVLQPPDTYGPEPAPITDVESLLNDDYKSYTELFRSLVVQPELPLVPQPEKPFLVPTGGIIPYYGIWEPVTTDRDSASFLEVLKQIFSGTQTMITGIDGCMNYLCHGTPAPAIEFPEDDIRNEGRPTTWRLIWIDDRYRDEKVPEKEAGYHFFFPQATIKPTKSPV